MNIYRIFTLANRQVALQFLAMERSLRQSGCDLPIQVIPFDDDLFALPKGSEWVVESAFFAKLDKLGAVSHCRKLLALTQPNAAFFDADIIHLENPENALALCESREEIIVADTEWMKARWTFTPETKALYQAQCSTWILRNFNTGFFCQQEPVIALDSWTDLLDDTLIELLRGHGPTPGEQSAINYLVFKSARVIRNLCLPPCEMESTMAVDYPEEYESLLYRSERRPFFIHFAGPILYSDHPIQAEFTKWLTKSELQRWNSEREARRRLNRRKWPLQVRFLNNLLKLVGPDYHVLPRSA